MIGSDGLYLRKPAMKIKRSLLVSPQFNLTQVNSPEVVGLFFDCHPDLRFGSDLNSQVRSLYRGIFEGLNSAGASAGQVVMEKLFFQDAAAGSEAIRNLRAHGAKGMRLENYSPASILIEEPPSTNGELCNAQVQVVIPVDNGSADWRSFSSSQQSLNGGRISEPATGKVLLIDGKQHIWIGNILGQPEGDFFSEALDMFEMAEKLIASQGFSFRDVVRTWIYLREMERDYAELNRARRKFFQQENIERRPASTGIGGAPSGAEYRCTMGLYAAAGLEPDAIKIMRTPTLNEAHEYGSDFSRGMSVEDGSLRTLYISGTASVDEEGRTVAVDDFDAQVDRMFLNVETLLENESATFENVVAGITYLKDLRDLKRFQELLVQRGLPNFPHSIVKAEVCRPELLCEMEVIAVVPSNG